MVALPVKARIVSRDDHEPRIDQALNDGKLVLIDLAEEPHENHSAYEQFYIGGPLRRTCDVRFDRFASGTPCEGSEAPTQGSQEAQGDFDENCLDLHQHRCLPGDVDYVQVFASEEAANNRWIE